MLNMFVVTTTLLATVAFGASSEASSDHVFTWQEIYDNPVDWEKLNANLEQIFGEIAGEHLPAFTLATGPAIFSRYRSKALAYAQLRPFDDASTLRLQVNYSKHLGFSGMTNEFRAGMRFEGAAYQKARFVIVKYLIPQILAEEMWTETEFFDEICASRHERLTEVLDRATYSHIETDREWEHYAENLQEALFESVGCSFLNGFRSKANYLDFVKFLSPQLERYKKSIDLLDNRHWAVKLFSGYNLVIEDCTGWWQFFCTPRIGVDIRVGIHGVTHVWSHFQVTEQVSEIEAVAYAPTFGTGLFTQGDLDKMIYEIYKDAESYIDDAMTRNNFITELKQELERIESEAWFQQYEQVRQDYGQVDWDHANFSLTDLTNTAVDQAGNHLHDTLNERNKLFNGHAKHTGHRDLPNILQFFVQSMTDFLQPILPDSPSDFVFLHDIQQVMDWCGLTEALEEIQDEGDAWDLATHNHAHVTTDQSSSQDTDENIVILVPKQLFLLMSLSLGCLFLVASVYFCRLRLCPANTHGSFSSKRHLSVQQAEGGPIPVNVNVGYEIQDVYESVA
jgi:hypothetical protein